MPGGTDGKTWWWSPREDGDFVMQKYREGVFRVGYKSFVNANGDFEIMSRHADVARRLGMEQDELEVFFRETLGARRNPFDPFMNFPNRKTARRAREWCNSVLVSNKLRGVE